jgi:hypothetical protein
MPPFQLANPLDVLFRDRFCMIEEPMNSIEQYLIVHFFKNVQKTVD